ncbi:MAG: Fic family protein [Nanoarchaeota archaeon]|nr:Fic family protein [Nanoarchaeota archaeon]MBU1028496.1 Fic family protein [Nanoarchaeota archaeon]
MVIIRKKTVKGNSYFYLEHSFRKDGKVEKKELYLGKEIPKDIEKVKKEFISEIYNETWLNQLDKIKENYFREQKKTPHSAREKEIENFMIKFTYNTQRIEGSKLTLRDTANLLEKGEAPKKPLRDIKEAEAHKKVFYEMLKYPKDLNLQIVLQWNKTLLSETKPDIAGKIRNHGVAISGSKFIPPLAIELEILLKEFFNWYNKNKGKLHPVVLSALVHLKFVTIHPFSDGNGRISRLMMNFILKKNGFPMLDIPYENRNGYYTALERSQVKQDEKIFLQWFFKRYLKEYKRLI